MPQRSHSEIVASLVNIATTEAVCFRSRENVVYYCFPCSDDGHQAVAVHSDVGRAWLIRQYNHCWREPPSRAAVSEAVVAIIALPAAHPPSTSMSLQAVKPSGSPWRNHVLAFDDVLRIPPAAESNLAIYT